MKLIAHISDPHFGKHDPTIARALLDELNTFGPALVVVSGDLTQRARRKQFDEARSWLAALEVPSLVVPGNHDISAFDVVRRILVPRHRYRAYVSRELEPWFVDDELAVSGIDTTKRVTTKHGRVTRAQAERATTRFAAHPRRWRLLVAHHPLIVPPGFERDRADGSASALPILEHAGVDVILTGHLHIPYSEGPAGRDPAHRMIAVHAGTCMSTRLRGEPNGYNHLRFEGEAVTIVQREWAGDRFVDGRQKRYQRDRERARVVKVAERGIHDSTR